MKNKMHLHHIGIHCDDYRKAFLFYHKILGLDHVKSFTIQTKLAKEIFSIDKTLEVLVFQNDFIYLEIIISDYKKDKKNTNHICLCIENISKFIEVCKDYNVEVFNVKKENKELLFIKDFSGNLFELKEIK